MALRTLGDIMKKLITLSVLATISLSTIVNASEMITGADAATSTGAGAVVSYAVNPSAGTIVYFGLRAAETLGLLASIGGGASSVATSNANVKKEIADKVKADIQDFNLNGELSPILSDIVKTVRATNDELSTEDILSNLDNNL